MDTLTYRLGGFLSGNILTLDNDMVRYKGPYGTSFAVPRDIIDAVVVDTAGSSLSLGHAILRLVGAGTTLASVQLPASWAEDAQRWLNNNLNNISGWVCAKCGWPLQYTDDACIKCQSAARKWAGG